MTGFADLHIHTFYSDSSSSPEEVVQEALKNQLCAIAITDHDTIDGVVPTQKAARPVQSPEGLYGAREHELEVIPGIELSSEVQGKDIHILGYFIDLEDEVLKAELDKIQNVRGERIREMIERLKKQGIHNITPEEVSERAHSKSVGRPHLAAVLQEKGWVTTLREAFDRYLGEECPAYVPKFPMSPYQAIAFIRKFKGVAVMAHPMITQRDELIPGFIEAGLQGIEVYYPNYSNNSIEFYEGIARKHNLVCTGGSDAHGKNRPTTYVGKKKVPIEVVERLKELRGQ